MADIKKMTLDQADFARREKLALSKLTDKQKKFCEAYVRTFDKVVALREGGYYLPKHTDKSPSSAQTKLIDNNFDRILESAAVQEYITLLKQSVASRIGVSMDDIINEYKNMAFTNMDDYVEWTADGFTSVKSSEELTKAQKAGILEITETTTKAGKTVKIKLHNKQAALDRLFELLKELEKHEADREPAARVSPTQINLILADPIKRRAIEHLADSLFDRRISLVGTDTDRIAFDKNMEKIARKMLEVKSGIAGQGSPGVKGIEAPPPGGGEGENAGNHRDEDHPGENQNTKRERFTQGGEEGSAVSEADAEGKDEGFEEEGNRYPVDGL